MRNTLISVSHFIVLAHIQHEICHSPEKSNQDSTQCLHCSAGAQAAVVHVSFDNSDAAGLRGSSIKSQPPWMSVLLCKLDRCWCLNSLYQLAQHKTLCEGLQGPHGRLQHSHGLGRAAGVSHSKRELAKKP